MHQKTWYSGFKFHSSAGLSRLRSDSDLVLVSRVESRAPYQSARASRSPATSLLVLALALAAALGTIPSVARCATFTVNTTDDLDDRVCDGVHRRLREAINAAAWRNL